MCSDLAIDAVMLDEEYQAECEEMASFDFMEWASFEDCDCGLKLEPGEHCPICKVTFEPNI